MIVFVCFFSEISPIPSPNSSITPPAIPPKQRPRMNPLKSSSSTPPRMESPTPEPVIITSPAAPQSKTLPDLLEHATVESAGPIKTVENVNCEETNPCDIDLMEELDVDKYLVWKPPEEDGPDIRGGTIDALIIQATKATKNGGE